MAYLASNDPYTTNCPDAATIRQLAPRPVSNQTDCAVCGPDTRMMTAETAAVVCQCSRRIIYRWIEEGALHFAELADRSVLVCGRSVAAKLEELENATSYLHLPQG